MNKFDRSALSDAIADRVRSLARTSERLGYTKSVEFDVALAKGH
jgi:hypothetical protein